MTSQHPNSCDLVPNSTFSLKMLHINSQHELQWLKAAGQGCSSSSVGFKLTHKTPKFPSLAGTQLHHTQLWQNFLMEEMNKLMRKSRFRETRSWVYSPSRSLERCWVTYGGEPQGRRRPIKNTSPAVIVPRQYKAQRPAG